MMEREYEVTIGIPVYNVKKYIRQTMDSALAQTFQSIEFLICDDCGTDGSMDIVREYRQSHPRGKDIRVVRQPQNGGIGRARNRLVQEADGQYIYFLDADDTISAEAIEILYNKAALNQADLVYGSSEYISERGDEVRREQHLYPSMSFSIKDEFAQWAYRKYDRIHAPIWNILIRVSTFRDNNILFPSINYWEDFAVTMDLPTYATRVVLMPDVTYYYYLRNGTLSNFQKRDHIDKKEILRTVQAMRGVKDNVSRLRGKPYFPHRMYKVMMTDFYMVCSILRNKDVIQPSFTKREIRDVMCSPLTLKEILSFRQARFKNLLLFLLGKLPLSLSVLLMESLARVKHLK